MRVQSLYTFMLIPQPQAALAVAPVEEGRSSNTSTNSGSSSRARITFSVGSCTTPSAYFEPGPTGDSQTVLQGGVVQGGVLQGGLRQGGVVGALWHSADVADPQRSAVSTTIGFREYRCESASAYRKHSLGSGHTSHAGVPTCCNRRLSAAAGNMKFNIKSQYHNISKRSHRMEIN